MKKQEIYYHNQKTKTSLIINIKAYEIDYQAIYPRDYVTSKFFDLEEAKKRLPVILGINANQRSKIINHVVASLHDYLKFLEDEKLN